MVSRIDLGPDGGPYVEIDEDAGDLVIRVPNDTVDFDSNDLLNAVLQNATMDGGSLDGVSLASALDANNQDLNSVGAASVASLEAESLVNGAIYPGNYDGDDADARLESALSDAVDGDRIILETESLNNNKTINDEVHMLGNRRAVVNAAWTVSDEAKIDYTIFGTDGSMSITNDRVKVSHCNNFGSSSQISVEADNVLLQNIGGTGNVEFATETAGGEIGIVGGDLTITDNGNNSILGQ